MMTPRYAPVLCALIAVALVPTLIHSYARVTITDDRSTAVVPTSLAGFTSTPLGQENAGWGDRRFASHDWFQRRYVAGSDDVVLTVIRSYDLKRLYHHPEIDVARGTGFLRDEVKRFPQRPDLPVHVLYTDTAPDSIAAYVLHFDNRYVEEPIRFQIRTAAELLFSGRKPMTLLFAHDLSVPEGSDVDRLPALSLLFAAVDAFVAGTSAGTSN